MTLWSYLLKIFPSRLQYQQIVLRHHGTLLSPKKTWSRSTSGFCLFVFPPIPRPNNDYRSLDHDNLRIQNYPNNPGQTQTSALSFPNPFISWTKWQTHKPPQVQYLLINAMNSHVVGYQCKGYGLLQVGSTYHKARKRGWRYVSYLHAWCCRDWCPSLKAPQVTQKSGAWSIFRFPVFQDLLQLGSLLLGQSFFPTSRIHTSNPKCLLPMPGSFQSSWKALIDGSSCCFLS